MAICLWLAIVLVFAFLWNQSIVVYQTVISMRHCPGGCSNNSHFAALLSAHQPCWKTCPAWPGIWPADSRKPQWGSQLWRWRIKLFRPWVGCSFLFCNDLRIAGVAVITKTRSRSSLRLAVLSSRFAWRLAKSQYKTTHCSCLVLGDMPPAYHPLSTEAQQRFS